MFHRRRLVRTSFAFAAVPMLIALGACGGQESEAQSEAGTNDGALDRFYNQELEFGSCEGYAPTATEEQYYVEPFECGRLEVPLNYDEPDGETAWIGVMRLAAKGERIGSLVLNPGGPGGSGMTQAAVASVGLKDTEVLQRFDMVGFDPRGVGASTPAIDCFTDEERDRGEDWVTSLGTAGEWTEDYTQELADTCAEGSGGEDVLASVGSRNVARDMDVLRAALGEEKLTYAGQSYGTRLGAVYAEMFPEKVRAMVLDGAIDPTQSLAERRLELQVGFQRSFDLMAKSCATSQDCPLGTDPGKATEVFQDLVRPLIDEPVPAGEGRELGFNQATGGVTTGLYYSEQWPAIIDAIAQLKNERRGDKLMALSDSMGVRGADGAWNNQTDANLAINCNDEQRRSPEEEAKLRTELAEVSPFMDSGEDFEGASRDACEKWPGEPSLGFPYAQNVQGLPETLVISVTGDPVTPYDAGKTLAESLGGTMLTVEGERHTVAQAGTSPCVNDLVAEYLINLKTPAEDQRCSL
ncbi:alpha/beta hydrolase [Prauserella cavernicola]|uniref:Alpha/beta fold hydrolase n=1 Tax=Prauserella cavernicola TaxID=2800127 RepID=A0A934QR33_9PSEU|nr:alpha/beta hydrolase [Prauserella cavernicola]MBK1783854.1 alpha/beta fold hydrolase [Prauserella cavernicola]